MALKEYWRKRDFKKTKEPSGKKAKARKKVAKTAKKVAAKSKSKSKLTALSFVIQKHDASHLHYDFRLEFAGVLKSWSVPKGPSLDPAEKRLAVEVEDHPLDYASFEGVIPAGEYGGGDVIVWDRGTWKSEKNIASSLKTGRLEFSLKGEKLAGNWILIRTGRPSKKPQWLLIKRHDDFAKSHDEYDVVAEHPESVKTGHLLPRDEAGDSDAGTRRKKAVKKKPLPGFIKPQLAKLVETPPEGEDWIHEIKYDGYRLITTIDGRPRLFTRSGLDWTSKFTSIAKELESVKTNGTILDGEIVFVDKNGRNSFSDLQTSLSVDSKKGEDRHHVYYVFDLLFEDGEDLRELPLLERKARLKSLLAKTKSKRIIYSQEILDEGSAVLGAACELDMEGIISKRVDATYESSRSGTWLKSKCTKGQEFVIGGYSSPKGSRTGFGALLVGAYDKDGLLQYVGRVGTGFNDKVLTDLRQRFKKLETDESPFDVKSPTEHDITFLKPKLVGQFRFAEWTKDQLIRHSVFDGLREDKDAKLVKIEKPSKTKTVKTKKKATTKSSNEFRLTHPDKILYPEIGVTKQMMAEYYEKVQDLILPHAKNRPLSLVRCPDGAGKECFFQKKLGHAPGKDLHSQKIKGRDKNIEVILTI